MPYKSPSGENLCEGDARSCDFNCSEVEQATCLCIILSRVISLRGYGLLNKPIPCHNLECFPQVIVTRGNTRFIKQVSCLYLAMTIMKYYAQMKASQACCYFCSLSGDLDLLLSCRSSGSFLMRKQSEISLQGRVLLFNDTHLLHFVEQ